MVKRIEPSPELRDALKKVLNHLNQNPGRADLSGEKLWLEYGTKYIRVWWSWTVLVLTPDGEAYEPTQSGPGRSPNFNRPVGNILHLVQRKNWSKQVRFTLTQQFRYPHTIAFTHPPRVPSCTAPGCIRTGNLRDTVLGRRCAICRGVDTRHMNTIRQLGGVPRAHGRVLRTNEDYYRSGR